MLENIFEDLPVPFWMVAVVAVAVLLIIVIILRRIIR